MSVSSTKHSPIQLTGKVFTSDAKKNHWRNNSVAVFLFPIIRAVEIPPCFNY